MKKLSEDKQKQLAPTFIKAILSAYPTVRDLEMMVGLKLCVNFHTIVGEGNLNYQVFYLVNKWAIPQGKFNDLLEASYNYNPNNPILQKFYEEVKQLPDLLPDPPLNEDQPVPPKQYPPLLWPTRIGNTAKSKIIASGLFFIFGLTGFVVFEQIKKPNYNNLETLLKAKNWEEADNETSKITRQILNMNKNEMDKNQSLSINVLKTFPCTDLLTIEQLWRKYSDGRFAFSKQQQIMSNLLSTQTKQQQKEDYAWKSFKNQVGWNRTAISAQNAPDGHFPAIGNWWTSYQPGWLEELFKRLDTCEQLPSDDQSTKVVSLMIDV